MLPAVVDPRRVFYYLHCLRLFSSALQQFSGFFKRPGPCTIAAPSIELRYSDAITKTQ